MAILTISDSKFYLNLPYKIRRELERGLVNILDNDSASESFSDIVREGVDVTRSFDKVLNVFLEGGSSFRCELDKWADTIKTAQRLFNYEVITSGTYETYEQLDLLCACSPEKRGEWQAVCTDYSIKTRLQKVKLCSIKGCSYEENAFSIPISQNVIYIPDEGGLDEEEVIPELKIVFPMNKTLFRRFMQTGNSWFVTNTCIDHGSKEVLQAHLLAGHYTFERPEFKAVFSDLIFDEATLKKPKGIEFDYEKYKVTD